MENTCIYCLGKVHADNMCQTHYRRLLNSKIDESKIKEIEELLSRKCCLSGCKNPGFTNGLCYDHFHEVLHYGHPQSLNKKGYEKFDPDKVKKAKCAVKSCKNKNEKGSWLCDDHTKQLRSIHENESSYDDEIEGKLEAFDTKAVSLDEIDHNDHTYKMRQMIDDKFVRRLAGSIRNIGLLHTPVLQKLENKNKYRIVSGYCRLAALTMLSKPQPKYKRFNALIIDDKTFSHLEMLKLAHEENHKRSFISYLEKALKASELRNEHALTNKEIAGVMDITSQSVGQLLRMVNKAHNSVLKALRDGEISFKHVQLLIPLEIEDQKNMLNKVIDEKLSKRDLEEFLKERKDEAFEEDLNDFIQNPPKGVKVKKTGRGKYKVEQDIDGIDNMRELFRVWRQMGRGK